MANGSGSSTSHSAAVIQAMQAWASDVPQDINEFKANLTAMDKMYVTMGDAVRQWQSNLSNMPPGPNGERRGIDPRCLIHLSGAADETAAIGAKFIATLNAFNMLYADLINHYQSGTPDPGRKFFTAR